MHHKSKSAILRELFASTPVLRIVGAHNALGAKLIERHGFEGVWASGLEISTAHAVPDANILTMTDNLHAAAMINDATSLPVICDCDTGYGNASNVRHMVRKYEAAGLAGVVIEDKNFPKVNSFIPGRQDLAGIEEFSGKIEAAKNAQISANFMVFARVEALIAGWGLEEALKRADAYAKAGADGIVIHSKAKTPEEVFAFAKRWESTIPLVVIPTMFYGVSSDELAQNGFKMVIYANQALRASIRAMDDTLRAIAETKSTAAVESKIASMKEVFELQGMADIQAVEDKFSKKEIIQAVIPAAGDHRSQSGFEELLKDGPLCMLDIGGKTLLDRQTDALRSCGVNDITVIGGAHSGKIKAESTRVIENNGGFLGGSAASILSARPHWKNKCVVAYSDILFDRRILEQLLKSPHGITLVIDRAYTSLPFRDKRIDLVIAEDGAGGNGARQLELNQFKRVRRVGQRLDPKRANYEFIGMAYFQEDGLRELEAAWEEALKRFHGLSFYEAASPEKADFNDLIQWIIDRDYPVYGLEIEHGWSEIHSSEDVKRVRSHFEKSVAAAARP